MNDPINTNQSAEQQPTTRDLLTNQDFDWTGAHTIKVYKITTSQMNDYDRTGTGENWTATARSRPCPLPRRRCR